MAKTNEGFENSLLAISAFGFAAISLNSFSSFDLTPFQTAFFLIAAGIGLMIEGQILTIRKVLRDGVTGSEVPIVLTVVVGLFSAVIGFLSLPAFNITNPTVDSLTGLVSVFALIFIVLQKFVFD